MPVNPNHIFVRFISDSTNFCTALFWGKPAGLNMAGMINCMQFQPKVGQEEALFKAFAEYIRDYPFDDIMHHIIDLGTGEYALIGVHHNVESFIDIMNRENRVSDMMRLYVEPYEDGESFHSFSGPVVNYNDYL